MARVLLDRHVWLDDVDWRSTLSRHLPPEYYPRRYTKAMGRDYTWRGFYSYMNRSISKTVDTLERRGEIEQQGDKVRLTDKGQKAKTEDLRRAAEAPPGSLLRHLLRRNPGIGERCRRSGVPTPVHRP
jgi:hypothetical protein